MKSTLFLRATRCFPVSRTVPASRLNNFTPLTTTRFATMTKGDQPNATNLAKDSPQGSSSESKTVNEARSTGEGIQDTASVAQPHSQETPAGGQDEVQGSDPSKRDPNKPAEQKRKEIEEQGNKPLDAADK